MVLLGLEQQHSPDFILPVLCKLFCVIIVWKFTHITYAEQLLSLHGLYWSASSCLAHDSIKRKKYHKAVLMSELHIITVTLQRNVSERAEPLLPESP